MAFILPALNTDASAEPAVRVPITVLTGFLGSGKTTLLNRLLREPNMHGTAVVINEFGSVGLDHDLVDHTQENMVLLANGCICCTVRGDLVEAFERLAQSPEARRGELRHVVVETTGLADPAPILHTLMGDAAPGAPLAAGRCGLHGGCLQRHGHAGPAPRGGETGRRGRPPAADQDRPGARRAAGTAGGALARHQPAGGLELQGPTAPCRPCWVCWTRPSAARVAVQTEPDSYPFFFFPGQRAGYNTTRTGTTTTSARTSSCATSRSRAKASWPGWT